MNSKIRDILSLLSKLNFVRLWNILKIISSYYLTRLSGRIIHSGMPISVSIEPTTSCNLKCLECPSGQHKFTRPTGMLTLDFFQYFINQLHKNLLYLTLYFQGEPYLNPDFFDFVKYAKSKNIYTSTSTNGHFLGDENAKKTIQSGLDRLIISLDGVEQQTYASYRIGGSFDTVIDGIKNVVKWKKQLNAGNPFLIIQFLVLKTNESQIKDIKKLGKKLGVNDVQIKTAQIYNYKNGNPLIPTIDKYSRYKKMDNGTYTIKNKLPDHCFRMWSSSVITWDGLIVPCCFDKDAEHKLGNLKKQSFKDIWKGKKYNKFRNDVFSHRNKIDICQNCTEGTR